MPRLTYSKAKAAPPPTGNTSTGKPVNQTFMWCSEVRGFGVRVTRDGVRSYVVQTRINGNPVRKTLGFVNTLAWEGPPDAPGALDLAKLALSAARRGNSLEATLGKSAAQTFTLQQVWDAYAEAGFPVQGSAAKAGKLKRTSSVKVDASHWRCHLSKLARQPVASLTDPVVARWCDGIAKRSGIGSRNQSLRLLRSVVNFAKSRGLCETPAITVKAGNSKSVQNYLNVEELKRVDAACIELAKLQPNRATGFHVVRMLLHTGARKSEILGLRRDLADLERREVKLARHKGGDEVRTIMLSDKAVEILRSLPTYGDSPYFFPGRIDGKHYDECEEHKKAAFNRAGVKMVRLHDLRHSFASAAISNGVELHTVGKLLGHRNYKSTLRYAHLSDAAHRAGADKVASVLG